MIKLGVAGLLPAWQCITAEDCRRVHATGFKERAMVYPDPLHAEQTDILRVKESFRSANLEICQMNGGYRSL